jgi:ABC-2 type transport system ATP-binding protein
MNGELAIETSGLTKIYRSLWRKREIRAVDGVTLAVPRGTTYGLLGPNGAGKTTFIKMLLSAVRPTAGTARLLGRSAFEPASRRSIGYLPENHRFPPYQTGAGMLDCYAALSGLDAQARRQRIPELLELVGLKDWGTVRLGKYSKGMLQRVGLAQALIHRPQLLMLDEPSDGVDPVGRIHIREILHQLESTGVTIFINSHLLAEVELFCREVAILRKGQLVLSGTVKDLTAGHGYRLVAHGVPPALQSLLLARTGASPGECNGSFEVRYATREAANAAIDELRSAQCEIESLNVATSTLEEVFIAAIEGNGKSAEGKEAVHA